jgi:hypothetical protein
MDALVDWTIRQKNWANKRQRKSLKGAEADVAAPSHLAVHAGSWFHCISLAMRPPLQTLLSSLKTFPSHYGAYLKTWAA